MSQATQPAGPLEGITIIDMTHALAGPYCTQLLADLGAEVIKIEPPRGDWTRNKESLFATANRNKRSVTIDLKNEGGRELLRQLVAKADVLVENFRAGVMDRLGVGYEVLSAQNPKLVYACIRGFGDPRTGESPYKNWPSMDVAAQAMSGISMVTGSSAEPAIVGIGLGDIFSGAMAANGVLAGVIEARRSGKGQFVDVAMVDAMLSMTQELIAYHSFFGKTVAPQGRFHPVNPGYGLYKAADGWIALSIMQDDFFEDFCRNAGREEVLQDERLATFAARVQNKTVVSEVIEAWTITQTKQQIMDQLGGRIPLAPAHGTEGILDDEHFRTRDMLVEVEREGHDPIKVVGVPIKFTRTPGSVRHRAPELGEHTDEVLHQFGFDDQAIAALRAEGAIH